MPNKKTELQEVLIGKYRHVHYIVYFCPVWSFFHLFSLGLLQSSQDFLPAISGLLSILALVRPIFGAILAHLRTSSDDNGASYV